MKILSYISFLSVLLFVSCTNKEVPAEKKESFILSAKMLETTKFSDVKMEKVQNRLSFFGKITVDNNKMIEVFPLVGGSVSKVFVEVGDFVKKGDLLATIRSTEVAGFTKELEDAKNDVIVSKNNLKVAQELLEGKLNTERDVIEARSSYDKAMSQLNRIQETYNIYSLKSGVFYQVKAPIDGFVIERKINQDMLLRNDRTDNIFDIAEISEVWAIANVNETEIDKVKLGESAAISIISYPDQVFKGKVDKIYNMIDPETKAMKIRVMLNNDKLLLKPEMRAKINLSFTENETMLAIPPQALIFDNNKYYVMVFKDKNNIETREVEVYRQLDEIAFISSGLKVGEKIITANQLLIYDALND